MTGGKRLIESMSMFVSVASGAPGLSLHHLRPAQSFAELFGPVVTEATSPKLGWVTCYLYNFNNVSRIEVNSSD